ncbi:hypothetical protein RDWZM_003258 [Blomia tropicalis]|uniref:Uncharacterized protein n=1 Tax=Blomia tropicalis TaxID=40697 RepID=A0A9Q0MGJ9_BLOTA|nr:hypothetical protein RDWZM_003258 [Blomia tropicalis]
MDKSNYESTPTTERIKTRKEKRMEGAQRYREKIAKQGRGYRGRHRRYGDRRQGTTFQQQQQPSQINVNESTRPFGVSNGSQTDQQRKQTIQMTFLPMQNGQLVDQSKFPKVQARAQFLNSDVRRNPQIQDLQINPADIQFSVPDMPDSVSAQIIEQIRKQLGNTPVTIGELNNKFVNFAANVPGVLINRTMLTNVEEQTVEHTKTSRTSYSPTPAPTGYASSTTYPLIKSYLYNPAAPAGYKNPVNTYSSQNYQYTVPTYSSIDDYKKQEAANYQATQSYKKPTAKSDYQQPKETYSQTIKPVQAETKKNHYSPKMDSYKPAVKTQTYTEQPKVITKYVEVCSNPPTPPPYQPNPSVAPYQPNPYVNVAATLASYGEQQPSEDILEAYKKMAEVYAKIHESMAEFEKLKSEMGQSFNEAKYAHLNMPPMPTIPPIPSISPPIYQQAPNYPHPSVNYQQATYSTPSTSPKPTYLKPAPKYQQPLNYQKNPTYETTLATPPPPPPPPSPPSAYPNVAAQLAYPQDGNKVKISYHSVEENIQTNETVPYGGAHY